MAQETRLQLKTYFETSDVPTEAQYINLLDSIVTFLDADPISMNRMTDGTTKKVFTSTERTKLAALVTNYKGFHATPGALATAHPSGNNGEFAIVLSPLAIYLWDGVGWSQPATSGDVTSPANLTTDKIVVGNNNNKSVKTTTVEVDASGNISTIGTITSGLVNGRDIAADLANLDAILATGTDLVSTVQKAKINNFRGYYATLSALTTAIPTGVSGDYAIVEAAQSFYYWDVTLVAWTQAVDQLTDSEVETAYNNQVPVVTQLDAETGTSTTVYRWTPLRVKQAIVALATGGAPVRIEDTDQDTYFHTEVTLDDDQAVAASAGVVLAKFSGGNKAEIGDVDLVANSTKLIVDDLAQLATISAPNITIDGYPSSRNDGTAANALYTGASGELLHGPVPQGDVTAAAVIGDNLLVRGDGAVKGVQNSGITVDDSNNLTGVGTINGIDLAAEQAATTANTAKVTNANHTGDVTGATFLTIANDAVTTVKILDSAVTEDKLANNSVVGDKIFASAVTNAKLAAMSTARIKGRTTAGTGDPEDLTVAQVQAMLGISLYDDFWVDSGYVIDAITSGATSSNIETAATIKTLRFTSFDTAAEDYADFTFALPLNYNGGTVKAKFHWDADPTASGTAVFGIKMVALGDNSAYTTAFGTEVTVTDTLLTVGSNHISPATGAITIGGTPTAEKLCVVRVTVKTSSTITVNIRLKGIQFQYTKSTTQVAAW